MISDGAVILAMVMAILREALAGKTQYLDHIVKRAFKKHSWCWLASGGGGLGVAGTMNTQICESTANTPP